MHKLNLLWRPRLCQLGGLLLALLFVCGHAFAQGKEGANQPAFKEIDFNLNAGIVNQPLPFDVPFILRGSVPDTVIAVRGYVQLATTAPPPPPQPDGLQPIEGINCNGIEWSELNPTATWTAPPPGALPATGTAAIAAATRTFRLLIPAIEVNTNYCMHFELERAVSQTEADEFRAKAFTAIDGVLRTLGFENREISNQELEALRQRLIAAITATNSGIRAMRGTLFDPRPIARMTDTERQMAQGDLADRLVLALQPQINRIQQAQLYGSFVATALTEADAIRANAFLLKNLPEITKQLATGVASDGTTLQQLVSASPPTSFTMTSGLAPLQLGETPAEVVGAIWTVTSTAPSCSVKEIDTIRGNIVSARGFFERLGNVLRSDAFAAIAKTGKQDAEYQALLKTLVNGPILTNTAAASGVLSEVATNLCQRTAAINAMTVNLRTEAREELTLLTTTTGDFATRHTWYFSVDLGLAVAPVIGEVFPYVGVNIYFRPVNKEAALSSLSNTFSRRFSAMIGYTWTDNLLKRDQRLGLFTREQAVGVTTTQPADSMLVFGAGLRVTDALRLAGGALLFKARDPNPLITETNLELTPFFSMSFDWDAVATVKGLGGLMGFGNSPVPVSLGKPNPPPTPPNTETTP